MFHKTVNTEVLSDPSWWHWAFTVPLLAAEIAGVPYALASAAGLCCLVCGYYFVQIRAVQPFPVQIRLAYLMLLLCGIVPGMEWIHWVQLAGTSSMVSVGYCPLARILKLLPMNRDEPLTWSLVWKRIVQDPCAGGLIRWSSSSPADCFGDCSTRVVTWNLTGPELSPASSRKEIQNARHPRPRQVAAVNEK